MSTIMFDLDGVLRNFIGAWQKLWLKEFQFEPYDPPYWEYIYTVGQSVGMNRRQTWQYLFIEHGYELTAFADVYRWAHYAFNELDADGHKLIIGTNQPTLQMRRGTLAWLGVNDIVPTELIFAEDKRTVKADIYIDDYDKNLRALAEIGAGHVIGIKQPWNNPGKLKDVFEVPNLYECVHLIRKKLS